jgi:hypothetical protein
VPQPKDCNSLSKSEFARGAMAGQGALTEVRQTLSSNVFAPTAVIVLNIDAAACSVVHGNLHRRIASDEVCTDDISLDSRDQKDPIRIPDNRVVLDYVIVRARSDKTYTEVVRLSRVSISTEPVPTEPVAAGAAVQSYAAAGIGEISISY